ncbi:MAG TPA: PaaI family thioesterase [Thermoanaerobaculia bacterium]|nr:PaaI family thioesterase [Thermoanaerobaculia bacterium]
MTRYQTAIEEWLRKDRNPAPVAKLAGFQLTGFEDGIARMEMNADDRHHNPMGIVHGGVLCDLADAAMGVAFAASMDDGESFVTLQLAASYLRSIREGRLVATGRVVQRGRNAGHAEAEVMDVNGRLIARFSSTCLVVREGAAQARIS